MTLAMTQPAPEFPEADVLSLDVDLAEVTAEVPALVRLDEARETRVGERATLSGFADDPTDFAVAGLGTGAQPVVGDAHRGLLRQAAEVLRADVTADEMLRALFHDIREPMGVDAYFNFMVNEAGDALALASCLGVTDDEARTFARVEFGQAVCGNVALKRAPVVMSGIQASSDRRVQIVKNLGIRAVACNPLLAGDRLLGTLSFASRTRDEFGAEELAFFASIARAVALAHERSRLARELAVVESELDAMVRPADGRAPTAAVGSSPVAAEAETAQAVLTGAASVALLEVASVAADSDQWISTGVFSPAEMEAATKAIEVASLERARGVTAEAAAPDALVIEAAAPEATVPPIEMTAATFDSTFAEALAVTAVAAAEPTPAATAAMGAAPSAREPVSVVAEVAPIAAEVAAVTVGGAAPIAAEVAAVTVSETVPVAAEVAAVTSSDALSRVAEVGAVANEGVPGAEDASVAIERALSAEMAPVVADAPVAVQVEPAAIDAAPTVADRAPTAAPESTPIELIEAVPVGAEVIPFARYLAMAAAAAADIPLGLIEAAPVTALEVSPLSTDVADAGSTAWTTDVAVADGHTEARSGGPETTAHAAETPSTDAEPAARAVEASSIDTANVVEGAASPASNPSPHAPLLEEAHRDEVLALALAATDAPTLEVLALALTVDDPPHHEGAPRAPVESEITVELCALDLNTVRMPTLETPVLDLSSHEISALDLRPIETVEVPALKSPRPAHVADDEAPTVEVKALAIQELEAERAPVEEGDDITFTYTPPT